MKKKIVLVMGARPNFMKAAPIVRYFHASQEMRRDFDICLVHTGQHYDDNMSQSFLDQLGIKSIHHHLNVGSSSHADQTARIMQTFETVCLEESPNAVVVFGDINSTIACALVSVKMGIKTIHVEAGLRSFNRSMPEEINRLATDAIVDHHLVTIEEAKRQLIKEGIAEDRLAFVGNLMIDSLLYHQASSATNLPADCPRETFCCLTLHRPSNVDSRETLEPLLKGLREISKNVPIYFPCHPRTRSKIEEFGLLGIFDEHFVLSGPIDYLGMIGLYKEVKFMLTDSGGIQEETTTLGIPCLTIREDTERPITVSIGTNTLVGSDPSAIKKMVDQIMNDTYKQGEVPDLWDGKAAERCWQKFKDWL